MITKWCCHLLYNYESLLCSFENGTVKRQPGGKSYQAYGPTCFHPLSSGGFHWEPAEKAWACSWTHQVAGGPARCSSGRVPSAIFSTFVYFIYLPLVNKAKCSTNYAQLQTLCMYNTITASGTELNWCMLSGKGIFIVLATVLPAGTKPHFTNSNYECKRACITQQQY